jgi:hypothetical protein
MNRTIEVEERRVRQTLPALASAFEPNPALPQLVPDRAVLFPNFIEPIFAGLGGQPCRMLVGHLMHHVRDDAGDLPQSHRPSCSGAKSVFGYQAIILQRRPRRLLFAGA